MGPWAKDYGGPLGGQNDVVNVKFSPVGIECQGILNPPKADGETSIHRQIR